MKVYIVVLEDRHTDVQVEVFATKGSAVGKAMALFDAYGGKSEDEDGPTLGQTERCLLTARLTGEGDRLFVQEVEVQP